MIHQNKLRDNWPWRGNQHDVKGIVKEDMKAKQLSIFSIAIWRRIYVWNCRLKEFYQQVVRMRNEEIREGI